MQLDLILIRACNIAVVLLVIISKSQVAYMGVSYIVV